MTRRGKRFLIWLCEGVEIAALAVTGYHVDRLGKSDAPFWVFLVMAMAFVLHDRSMHRRYQNLRASLLSRIMTPRLNQTDRQSVGDLPAFPRSGDRGYEN